jgi:pimeloyl-ACP methyl ester carboxylesterase
VTRASIFRAIPFAVAFVLGALAYGPVRRETSAVGLLKRLSSEPSAAAMKPPPSFMLGEDRRAFRARLYVPDGKAEQCLVLGHGIHYKAIDDPRLIRFASELSKAGAAVLTPELADLADYRITRSGADVLGDSVRFLSAHCPATGGKVGLIGFSFAGGLSLLAALEPEVAPHLSFVTSVGGYHDLSRVLRFFIANEVEGPGGVVPKKAHEYGLIVLLYGHLEAFVPEEDYFVIRSAVQAWLHEDRKLAWTLASQRTTLEAEALFVRVAGAQAAFYRPILEGIMARSGAELAELSPKGKLAGIPSPVYLLHGTGDTVIPPEETLWAERELSGHPHRALITPLLEHVKLDVSPDALADAAKLVDFMSLLL